MKGDRLGSKGDWGVRRGDHQLLKTGALSLCMSPHSTQAEISRQGFVRHGSPPRPRLMFRDDFVTKKKGREPLRAPCPPLVTTG